MITNVMEGRFLMDNSFSKVKALFKENVRRNQGLNKSRPERIFTILCTFDKALCDLGASSNVMPLLIFKKVGLGIPKPTPNESINGGSLYQEID